MGPKRGGTHKASATVGRCSAYHSRSPSTSLDPRCWTAFFLQVLGFNRASGDAFGPFVTLLGLIYSILLGQIYEYYFNRQGVIQDALYQEISALSLLSEVTDFLADRCASAPLSARIPVAVSTSTPFTVQV